MNSPISQLKFRNLFSILLLLVVLFLVWSVVTAVADQHPLQSLLNAL